MAEYKTKAIGILNKNYSKNEHAPQFCGNVELGKKDYRVGIWAQKGPKGGDYYSISISSADEEDILYTPEEIREFIAEVADLVRDGYSEHDFLLPHERFF